MNGSTGMLMLNLLPMLALLAWAAAEDLRVRKIRNWLTFSLALGGIACSAAYPQLVTPGGAMLGLLTGFALTFVPFAMGALGGGDVKLLAGVGAWLGPVGALQVFMAAAIIGMLIVLGQCAWQGRLTVLFRNSAMLMINLVHVGDVGLKHATDTGKSCRSVDKPLPYAVPVLVAVLLVLATHG